jgi:site-specific DNA-cytosine methylase
MADLIVNLCCGLGRFTDDEISIDIDRKTKPTIIADVRWLPLRPALRPKLLHCSPPCTYVSEARRWAYGWNPKGVAETLEIIAACYHACVYLEADTFTLENPTGLVTALGQNVKFHYDKKDIYQIETNFFSNKKGLERAKIPADVKQAILDFAGVE